MSKGDKGKKRDRQTGLLLEVATKVAATETLDEVLRRIVEMSAGGTDAERGTLFLNDAETGELYSRVAQGDRHARDPHPQRHAASPATSSRPASASIIDDAYADPRFNRDDRRADRVRDAQHPVRADRARPRARSSASRRCSTSRRASSRDDDLALLEAMTDAGRRGAAERAVHRAHEGRAPAGDGVPRPRLARSPPTSSSARCCSRVDGARRRACCDAERSTLFLNDEKTDELFVRGRRGRLASGEIRLPNHRRHRRRGVHHRARRSTSPTPTPTCASTRRSTSRPASSPARSCACRSSTSDGKTIGVTQVLNKRGGPFTAEDESAAARRSPRRSSIALENAKLFDDVQNMKNYNEAMLAEHVERRHHARRGRHDRHLQRARACASCRCSAATVLQSARRAEFFGGAERAGCSSGSQRVERDAASRHRRWTRELDGRRRHRSRST